MVYADLIFQAGGHARWHSEEGVNGIEERQLIEWLRALLPLADSPLYINALQIECPLAGCPFEVGVPRDG